MLRTACNSVPVHAQTLSCRYTNIRATTPGQAGLPCVKPELDIQDSPSRAQRQPSLNISENSFSMEQEVESLVPV